MVDRDFLRVLLVTRRDSGFPSLTDKIKVSEGNSHDK